MRRQDSDDIDLSLYFLALEGVATVRHDFDCQLSSLFLGIKRLLDDSEAALAKLDVLEDEVFLLFALYRLGHHQLYLLFHII